MALNYDGAGGLFTELGELIAASDSLETFQTTTLPAYRDAIRTEYDAGNHENLIDGIVDRFDGWRSTVDGWRSTLRTFAAARLTDQTTVLDELGLATSSTAAVLAELVRRMVTDSETVKRSVVTLGVVAANGSNQGNGTVLTTKTLDGFSAPRSGVAAHAAYDGALSELTVPSEVMTIECTGDSQSDGRTEGQESFSWQGGASASGLTWETEGSGQGPGLATLNASTLVSGRDFETFTANVPTGWTLVSGTAGTHVLENATAANVYRGSKSLRLVGDGAQATISLSQAISLSLLKPRRRYALAIRYKASATPAAGNLVVHFEGTGYTASGSEEVNVPAGSLTTGWQLGTFQINLPSVLPSDFRLVVSWSGTPSSGVSLYLDSLAFGPMAYHGGVAAVVVAGSSRFVRGDRFTFTVANDGAGRFQEWFRRAWGVQLPSAASPTISDTLAGGT